jgi:hypothetical protein
MAQKPRLFYHCYDDSAPTGGQKHVYQHVDTLTKAGYDAVVVHDKLSSRLRWFENDTKVITWQTFWRVFDAQRDYLVLPEDLGERIAEYPGRKIIFNKNLYYGHGSLRTCSPTDDPYFRPEVVGIFAVSEHNVAHLQFAYPHQTVCRVLPHVDASIFKYRPLAEKCRLISCIPKGKLHLASIYRTLYARAHAGLNRALDYQWRLIEGKSEREVADTLQESMVFIFTSVEEGLGRAPLEAMLAGCVTMGFAVPPMTEYIPATFQMQVGNVIGCVKFIERLIAAPPCELALVQTQIEAARTAALQFSAAAQQKSVIAAWECILSRASSLSVGHVMAR